MRRFPPLFFMLCMSLIAFSQETKVTDSGWPYEVLKKGKSTALTLDKSMENHNQLIDANGRILVSTYSVGIPDYQLVSELSKGMQDACKVMNLGGKYRFQIPMSHFRAMAKGNAPPNLPGDYIVWEVELLRILPPLPDISKIIRTTIGQEGIESAFQKFENLVKPRSKKVYLGEWEVNKVGYLFLNQNAIDKAISVFEFNVAQHPKSANAYDSLAEAHLKDGNKEAAIKNYKQSLKLNPKNDNAKKILAEVNR